MIELSFKSNAKLTKQILYLSRVIHRVHLSFIKSKSTDVDSCPRYLSEAFVDIQITTLMTNDHSHT